MLRTCMKAPIEWYKGKGEGGGEGLKGCYATVAKIQYSFQNMKKYSMVGIKGTVSKIQFSTSSNRKIKFVFID